MPAAGVNKYGKSRLYKTDCLIAFIRAVSAKQPAGLAEAFTVALHRGVSQMSKYVPNIIQIYENPPDFYLCTLIS